MADLIDEKSTKAGSEPANGPPAAPQTTEATSSSSAVVRGASLLIILQIGSRAATFIANQLLLRFLTAQLLGVATQLEVYYLSVLFFARESLRVAIQRQGGRTPERTDDKEDKTDNSSQSAVNLAYVSMLIGTLVALLFGWLYLVSVNSSADAAVASTPFLVPALYLYATAALVELLSEPAFVVLQLRLQFGARAAAESFATVLRCGTTLGSAVVAARQGRDIGALPFALGQLAYGTGLLAVYAYHGSSLARREGFSLFPKRILSADAPAYVLALFDRPTLHLASSMAAQSVVKHILTQGDTFLVSILSTPTAQGVYALANNYGGLAARLLFQPIEESSRNYFSRLLATNGDAKGTADTQTMEEKEQEQELKEASHKAASRASQDLLTLLKLYVLLSVIITTVGPAASAPFLSLVTGPRWANSGAAATLAAYMWYIPLLAFNGVAEAFVASVATEAEVHMQSGWMGVFSLVFAGAGYVCLRLLDGGAIGLVVANGINMACRITWCAVFTKRYFAKRQVPISVTGLLPHPLSVLAAVVTSQAIQRLVVNDPATQNATGAVAQITTLVKIGALALPFVVVVAFLERTFLRQCYSFVRGGRTP